MKRRATVFATNRKDRNERGFTLLETLIAVVILTIGVLGYMAIQCQSMSGRVFSKRMNEAVLSGNTATEEMLTSDYVQMSGSGTLYRKDGGAEADEQDYQDGKAHRIQWSVTSWDGVSENPNAEIVQMKTVSLSTQWKEKEEDRSTRMATWARGGKVGDSSEP